VEVTVLIYFQKPIEQYVANEKATQAANNSATAQVRIDPAATPAPKTLTIENPIIVIGVKSSIFLMGKNQFVPEEIQPGQDILHFLAYEKELKNNRIFFGESWGWSDFPKDMPYQREYIKAWAVPSSVTNWPVEMKCNMTYFEQTSWRGFVTKDRFHSEKWTAESCGIVHVSGLQGDFYHLEKVIYLDGDLSRADRLDGKKLYFEEVWYRVSKYTSTK
ncbi:MAG: hypothetical protein AAB508_02815, partial [Patescibacteria group bacterium]